MAKTNRGVVFGRLEEAVASYRRFLQLDPNDAEVWFHHGLALYHLDRLWEARESFEKAAALGLAEARATLRLLDAMGIIDEKPAAGAAADL